MRRLEASTYGTAPRPKLYTTRRTQPNAAALANLVRHRRRLRRVREPELLGVLQHVVRTADGGGRTHSGTSSSSPPATRHRPGRRLGDRPEHERVDRRARLVGPIGTVATRESQRPDVGSAYRSGVRARVRRDHPACRVWHAAVCVYAMNSGGRREQLLLCHAGPADGRMRRSAPWTPARRRRHVDGHGVGDRSRHRPRRSRCTCTWTPRRGAAGRSTVGGSGEVPAGTARTTGSRHDPGATWEQSRLRYGDQRRGPAASRSWARQVIGGRGDRRTRSPPVGNARGVARKAGDPCRRMGDRSRHGGRRSRSTCTWARGAGRSPRTRPRDIRPRPRRRPGARIHGARGTAVARHLRRLRVRDQHADPAVTLLGCTSDDWSRADPGAGTGADRQVEGSRPRPERGVSQDGRSIPTPQRRSTCTSTSVRVPRRSWPTWRPRRRRAVAYPANGSKHGFRGTDSVTPGQLHRVRLRDQHRRGRAHGARLHRGDGDAPDVPDGSGGRLPIGNLGAAAAGHRLHPGRRLGLDPDTRHHGRARLRRRRRDGHPGGPAPAGCRGGVRRRVGARVRSDPADDGRSASRLRIRDRHRRRAPQRHRVHPGPIARPVGSMSLSRCACDRAHLNRASPAFPDSWSAPTSAAVLRRLGRTPHRRRSHGRWPRRSGGSPDEPAHIIKAASVVRGQFVGEPTDQPGGAQRDGARGHRHRRRLARATPSRPRSRRTACVRSPMGATSVPRTRCGRPSTTPRTTCSWAGRSLLTSDTSLAVIGMRRRRRPPGHVSSSRRASWRCYRLRPSQVHRRSGSRRPSTPMVLFLAAAVNPNVPRGRERVGSLISSLLLSAGSRSARPTMAVAGSSPERQGSSSPRRAASRRCGWP